MDSVKPSIRLDQRVADIVRMAIETTFHQMFNISAHCGSPVIGKQPFAEGPCIASMMDMVEAGEVVGVFVITFSFDAAKRLLQVSGAPQRDDPAVAQDAINEITNVIYGDVKNKLNQMGHNFVLKLPQTVRVPPQFFKEYCNSEKLALPFSPAGQSCHAVIMTKT